MCSELFSNSSSLFNYFYRVSSNRIGGNFLDLFYYNFLNGSSSGVLSFLSSLLATARSHTGYESNGGKIE
ncbi:MAG: hypothetical protein K2N16_05545 [Muribaculaceae bacterium]|nr:hypothetical protein [Muribaculaceae bacterium]